MELRKVDSQLLGHEQLMMEIERLALTTSEERIVEELQLNAEEEEL